MNFWDQKNVLLTGATGLLGSQIASRLCQEKAHVVSLVQDWNPQSFLIREKGIEQTSVVNGSLCRIEDVERAIVEYEIDTVIHLGAQTIVSTAQRAPLLTFEANIRGTYHLLEACRRQKSLVKRILVASSDKAYGTSEKLPYKEDTPLKGLHPYDVSKSCTDLLAQTYIHSYQLPVTITRCGNIYGPGDLNWNRLIPGTIRSVLANTCPLIRSDGKATRDYLYVEDIVDGCLALLEKGCAGEAFNLGPSEPLSVLEVVSTILTYFDKADLKPIIQNVARHEITHQYLDSEKIYQQIGWKPKYSLSQGLAKTVPWYQSLLDAKEKELEYV